MTFEQTALLADVISSAAILISLGFVVFQLRQAALLNRAKARHDISVFAFDLSKFQAEHADRIVTTSLGWISKCLSLPMTRSVTACKKQP